MMILFYFEVLALYIVNLNRKIDVFQWNATSFFIFLVYPEARARQINLGRLNSLAKANQPYLYRISKLEKMFEYFGVGSGNQMKNDVFDVLFYYPSLSQLKRIHKQFGKVNLNFEDIYLYLRKINRIENEVALLSKMGMDAYLFLNYVRHL